MKAAADTSPGTHPGQKYFQMEIGQAFIYISLAIWFGLNRVPFQPRFDLQ